MIIIGSGSHPAKRPPLNMAADDGDGDYLYQQQNI